MSIGFNPPISAEADGLPVLVLGTDDRVALCVKDDGQWTFVDIFRLTANWRYDWRAHRWLDVGDTDDTQDDAPDGGQTFSGHVPNPDQLRQGDSFHSQGGQAPGDLGDLDTTEAD
jgi:hypothetical protein